MNSLVGYAVSAGNSRGRRFAEAAPDCRTEFQRDRDRIVHSTAFRRLEYKTQVFVNHEGDLFRTRLTHSIEVAQIARTIARALSVNEDLTEAVALAHDLGHTPFGHAGQDALNECMQDYGGFEHNLQSLRTVDELEERYPEFPGLNLSFETREGIMKHCSLANAQRIGDVGQRFLDQKQASIEAQICNLADEIAYNNHDVDDGIRSGLLCIEQMESVRLFSGYAADVRRAYPQLSPRQLTNETVRRIINRLVVDLLESTQREIARQGIETLDDVRNAAPVVRFSTEALEEHQALKRFLRKNLYQHYQVLRMAARAKKVIAELFAAFASDPRLLPPQYQEKAERDTPRAIADYIAGMTDRYALKEHRRLFAIGEF